MKRKKHNVKSQLSYVGIYFAVFLVILSFTNVFGKVGSVKAESADVSIETGVGGGETQNVVPGEFKNEVKPLVEAQDLAKEVTDEKADTGYSAQFNEPEEKKKEALYKVKDKILKEFPQVSDIGLMGDVMAMVYTKIDKTDIVGSPGLFRQTNGTFLFIRVDVMNKGKKAQTIDSSMFTLVSPDGTIYESDPTAAIYANVDNGFSWQKLNPSVEASGYVVFDVPRDIKLSDVRLRLSDELNFADLYLTK